MRDESFEGSRVPLVILDGKVALKDVRVHSTLFLKLHDRIRNFNSLKVLENLRFLVDSSVLFLFFLMSCRGQLEVKSLGVI